MTPPALVEFGPWLITPFAWFWMRVSLGIYVFVGLSVWVLYVRDKVKTLDLDRVDLAGHILIGLLHGILWPVYAAFYLLLAAAS
jgi:hypothetical protein